MKKKINFATGTFYKQGIGLKEQIEILKELPLDGVELTFATFEELEQTLNHKEFLQFVSQYECNTIHAPFKEDYTKENFSFNMNLIKKLSDVIESRNVVFHLYNFGDISMLKNIPLSFTVENTLGGDWNSEKIVSFFRSNPEIKFTFDLCHALYFGKEQVKLLMDNLKNKIKTIHLSNIVNGKHHKQFFNSPEDIDKFVGVINGLNDKVIITVEENFDNVNDIKNELLFVRKKIEND
jgi:hypothetical protein